MCTYMIVNHAVRWLWSPIVQMAARIVRFMGGQPLYFGENQSFCLRMPSHKVAKDLDCTKKTPGAPSSFLRRSFVVLQQRSFIACGAFWFHNRDNCVIKSPSRASA